MVTMLLTGKETQEDDLQRTYLIWNHDLLISPGTTVLLRLHLLVLGLDLVQLPLLVGDGLAQLLQLLIGPLLALVVAVHLVLEARLPDGKI